MLFTVTIKTQIGRTHKLNIIAPSFEECLEKISSLYGARLEKIEYDLRKNSLSNQSTGLKMEVTQ